MAWRAFWRPSLLLASCALLGLLYFLANVPAPRPGPSALAAGVLTDAVDATEQLARLSSRRSPGPRTSTAHDAYTSPVDGYLVYSPSCRIPDTDPFHPSVQKLIFREEPVVCSKLPPLTTTRALPSSADSKWIASDSLSGADSVLRGARQHVLRLDTGLFSKYLPRFYKNITCCYSVVSRLDPVPGAPHDNNVDNKYKVGKCESLQSEAQLDPDTEFVLVRCSASNNRGQTKKVYTNMHAVVAPKESVRAKLRVTKPRPPGDSRLSVLIIGVDSVSRLNYLRTMPKTSDLLKSTGWYDLRGYNKIDDNTFPNLMAILTGMTRPQVEQCCFRTPKTPMDECPIIWRNFSRAGYVTAYVEDEPNIGTFNYHKAGFAQSPTDYYLRPFLLAAQDHLESKRVHRLNACLGPSTAAEHILSYASSMATILRNHLYFGLFWMNSFSHNNVNSPSSMDDRLFNFWRELLTSGALNKTMVIFLSDHGMRFGKIRETEIGWLEERLPFINIWLPEEFRAAYPQLDRGLRINENRLTTPWDLHVTLKDVLDRPWAEGRPPSAGNVSVACPGCSSLFAPVAADRSCDDVAIDPHWCTCIEYQDMSTEDHSVRSATNYVIRYIVDRLEVRSPNYTNPGTRCAPLSLNRVFLVRGRQPRQGVMDYIVTFETVPGKALFEATVRKDGANFDLLGPISRVNEFWEHSACIQSAELKKYCHCVKG